MESWKKNHRKLFNTWYCFPKKNIVLFEVTCYYNNLQILVLFGPTFYVFGSFHLKFYEHFHKTLEKREWSKLDGPLVAGDDTPTWKRLKNSGCVKTFHKLKETATMILEDVNISDCKWCYLTNIIMYCYLLKICHFYNR